ncbi:hypothetical protein EDB80DRAFT_897807 [Ilyonectria destructans]|nr:hypothetical protein EDB80DRAFT_897807 [Ilyonectria destructans]
MAPRISRQANTWLHTTKMKDSEEFWHLLNAAYWSGLSEPFHKISKEVIKFHNISLLQLASGTTDVALGFRLALALEELQKLKGRGLCLHCFKTATTKFLHRGAQCPAGQLH